MLRRLDYAAPPPATAPDRSALSSYCESGHALLENDGFPYPVPTRPEGLLPLKWGAVGLAI